VATVALQRGKTPIPVPKSDFADVSIKPDPATAPPSRRATSPLDLNLQRLPVSSIAVLATICVLDSSRVSITREVVARSELPVPWTSTIASASVEVYFSRPPGEIPRNIHARLPSNFA